MMERNQIGKNKIRINNAAATIRKNEHTDECFYSCKACGNTFIANPPDDVHKYSSVYKCWKFDWIGREYKCPSCSKTTTLFWHAGVHKYHDYATSKEVALKIGNGKLDDSYKWVKRMEHY